MKKFVLMLLVSLSFFRIATAQKVITGKVTDSQTGAELPGVTIQLKNGTALGASDASGNFSVTVPKGNNSVVFNTQNYSDVELSTNSTPMTVRMTRGAVQSLTEVVVTGYSNKSKRNFAGSSSNVSINEVRTQPIASFDQLLQGQSPGVFVKTGSGQPGQAATVQIRGQGSISGSTAPLYVLDGVQITAGDFATLNQGDFESVTLLKDAAATSIYGSRAAGGVVVITSRRGRVGDMKVNYDFQIGHSNYGKSRLRLMNSAEKLEYELSHGNPNNWTSQDVDSLSKINTDWQDVFFQVGRTMTHQLSFSGGTQKTRYYSSLGYFDQTGTVIGTGLKRYTGRMNLESGGNRLKVGLNTSFGYSIFSNTNENDQFFGSPLNAIRWSLPYITPFDANGNFSEDKTANGQPNPLRELLESPTWDRQFKGVGSVSFDYKLSDAFTLRSVLGGDFAQDETQAITGPNTYSGLQAPGGAGAIARGYTRTFRFVNTNSIQFKKTYGDHDIAVGLYEEQLKSATRLFGFSGYGLLLPFQNEAAITAGTSDNGFIPVVNGNGTENKLGAFFVDADYGFKNRYFIHGGARRDGSSRFGENKQWANFYNVGASWIASDEAFFSGIKNVVNFLKAKISYGTVGNQVGIGDFGARSLFGRARYAGSTGLALASAGNPDLTWEEKSIFNTGLEFGAWKNRISGSVEYYDSRTKSLFYNLPLPLSTGFASRISNAGVVSNKGIEANLRIQPIKWRDFTWTIDGNFTYNKNNVESLANGKDTVANPNAANDTYLKLGKPLNTWYLVRFAGVDPQTGDPLYYTADGKNTTNVYNPADRVFLGTSTPPYFGGITNTFNYKGAELSVFWVFSLGNKILNIDRMNVENPLYGTSEISADLIREWRNPGDITVIPRASADYNGVLQSDYFLENGGFWRLRNIRFSYEFSKRTMQVLKLNTLKVFVQGENLYTYTKFRGFDPEIPPGSASTNIGAQYPTLKTVTLGLSVGF